MIYTEFAAIPRGRYAVVYADPPWRHSTWSAKGATRRSPSHHYPVLDACTLSDLPIAEIAARDAHLFLWTTGPHLEQALALIRAWGFRYSSLAFVWLKLNPGAASALWLGERDLAVGLGYTTRQNAEMVLLGRRGSPGRLSAAVRQPIVAARREHSRKPDEAARRIIEYAAGPRIELFAREPREGFDAFGNEPTRFGAAA